MIREVSVELVTLRLASRVESAAGAWTERRALLITLESDSGAFGQGEVAPLPGYSPDSLEACREALEALDPQALAEVLAEPDAKRMLAQGLALLPAEVPAARFGLETALLDLRGKLCGTPAWELFGASPGLSLPLAAWLGSAGDPELRRSAERAFERGISTLKVKVGLGDFAREMVALKELTAALPLGTALRLDANQSLSAASLAELAALDPEFVEEPLPTAALFELSVSFVPLALDESLQARSGAPDLSELLSVPNLRAVVLKPMALGGILRCMEIAAAARARRIDVVVSHLFDGPLALTGAAVLALQAGSPGVAMGLDRHAGLDAWGHGAPAVIASGRLEGWRNFGLGLPRLGAEP